MNQVSVFDRDRLETIATIPTGKLPHGIWPSGDGSRVYVGLENDDAMDAIDTSSNRVIATIPIGQAPQAVTYVPDAAPAGDSREGLQSLGLAGSAVHLALGSPGAGRASTSVTLFDQGLVQVVQASVTGLQPKIPYVLALAAERDGSGPLQSLAGFMTNPAGAAIVNASGPIRQLVAPSAEPEARRWLVIAPGKPDAPGAPVQVSVE